MFYLLKISAITLIAGLINYNLIFAQISPDECPDCSTISCFSTITQNDCAANEFISHGAGVCGCCPACVTGRTLGQTCSPVDPSRSCAPGLICSATESICIVDTSTCTHTHHLTNNQLIQWLPKCDVNGNYEAKQCKGDRASGRCFCVNNNGDRIFGWDWWRNSENMTCACSRKRNDLESQGLITTLHCDQNGNFEELQCDNGICWCAEPETGKIELDTIAVPESMWTMLPCCKYII